MNRNKLHTKFAGLKKEISFALLLKVAIILVIWYVCFSDPVSKHLTDRSYLHHFVSVSA